MTLPDDSWRKQRSKKDTKRWCKGVVGREHTAAAEVREWRYGSYLYLAWGVCSVCKKRMKKFDQQAHDRSLPVIVHYIDGKRVV